MASIYHSKSLNINNCFEEELLSLKGIGKCIAKRIIKQRAVCAFSTAEDFIERVKGIGQTSWRRVALQNEVNIVFGAQAVRSVERITGKMNQRRRGRLILPQDPTFYRKGQWVVIDSQYRALYPRTLWGVIESDGINENGILTVRTGRIQLQNINWKHCVVEQFRRKEVVQLINAEQYKEHMGDDQSVDVHVVRYENGDPNTVRVVPFNFTDFESITIDYNSTDSDRLQRDSFVVQHTDLIRSEREMEDEFDHKEYWGHHGCFEQCTPLSSKGGI